MIALRDIALTTAVMMGVDRQAERAEARRERPVEDRLDPILIAADIELEDLQPLRCLRPVSSTSGLDTELWNMGQPKVPAASATAALAARIESLDAADRGERDRHGEAAAKETAAGVGAVHVAKHTGPQRLGIERQPVAPEGGFGLGTADQIVPHIAVEPFAGGGDDLVQVLKAFPDGIHGLVRCCVCSIVRWNVPEPVPAAKRGRKVVPASGGGSCSGQRTALNRACHATREDGTS